MFRIVPLSIIRSFSLYTQSYIEVCWQLASRIRTELQFRPDPARKLSAYLYDMPLLCVQWKTPDDGQRNCPKHIELYSKNKFEKFVHRVGFHYKNFSLMYSHVCIWRLAELVDTAAGCGPIRTGFVCRHAQGILYGACRPYGAIRGPLFLGTARCLCGSIRTSTCSYYGGLGVFQSWNLYILIGCELYDIYRCCVCSETPDDGQRNCPKHVEFYSKNKFEKLVHLVGFIIRIALTKLSPSHQAI